MLGAAVRRPFQYYRDCLRTRRTRDPIICVQRQQRIRFGIIGGTASVRDAVIDDFESAEDAFDSIGGKRANIHAVFGRKPTLFHLIIVQKQNIALIVYSAIAIAVSVNSGVVLIVTANRAQPKRILIILMLVFVEAWEDDKVGLAVRGLPDPLARGVG
jgi:hypothetical protein